MDISSINSDLIRGNVTTIILKALLNEDRYGYDILKEIEVKSQGQYKLKQPTLYSCLKRLEKQGLINSYWGDESDTEGGRRRYYSLTDAGKSYVSKMQSEYEFSRTIMDKLLSEEEFDFENTPAPFDINGLRPYTKRKSDSDDDFIDDEKTNRNVETVASSDLKQNGAEIAEKKVAENSYEKNSSYSYDTKDSSYDAEKVRHTKISFSEMLDELNRKAGKSPESDSREEKKSAETDVAPEAEPIYEKQIAADDAKVVSDDLNAGLQVVMPPAAVKDEKTLSEDRRKRDDAKKLLGLGEKEIETAEVTERVPDKDLKPQAFDIFSKIPINEQLKKNNPETKDGGLDEKKEIKTPDLQTPEFISKPQITVNAEKDFEARTSAANRQKNVTATPSRNFKFKTDDAAVVNYFDAFGGLRSSATNADDETDDGRVNLPSQKSDDEHVSTIGSLKARMYSLGYKLRPYTRENTEEYYALNFLNVNRLARDSYLTTYALILAEIFVMWLVFKDAYTAVQYSLLCVGALPVAVVPFVVWTLHPNKRIRANYSFKTSILNRLMLYLNCVVVVCLLGFFVFGADINDANSLINPILLPILFLLNIPLSAIVYLIFYSTGKYHIS